MSLTTIPAQSTIYVESNISAPSSPLAASVSWAFLGPYTNTAQANEAIITSATTYYVGSWDSIQPFPALYPARCLVGPSGVVSLTTGTYAAYVKISGFGDTEVPVLFCGPLVVD